jgi:RNA polymerase sigma factor (sigma-70 family)
MGSREPHPNQSTPFHDGDRVAVVERLDSEMRERMLASLRGRGANEADAEDVVADVFTECLRPDGESLLSRYHRRCAFDKWLLRVAINRLISRQRRARMLQLMQMPPEVACEDEGPVDAGLRELVLDALRGALDAMSPQDRVLLWMRHGFGISQKRLCVAWKCHPTRMSRMLAAARERLRRTTIERVRVAEPDLVVGWMDIAGACTDGGLFFRT